MADPRARAAREGAGASGALGALLVALALAGCASHAHDVASVHAALTAGDVLSAVSEFEKTEGRDDDLLYLLEKGHIMHLAARWDESNDAFDAAERRAEDLYTKSVSREVAAFLTSDLATEYRSAPFELQMVPYYRALNYLATNEPDEALVEARKANSKLAMFLADDDPNDASVPRQAAFLQYVTGLIYESEGEANDAAVALREAMRLYGEEQTISGRAAPDWLPEDFYAVAKHLDLSGEIDALLATDPDLPRRVAESDANNLVVFLESGFVPYREEVEIVLPIFDDEERGEDGVFLGEPQWYVDRYSGDVYAYRADRVTLDHVLSFAFPSLVTPESDVRVAELLLSDGSCLAAQPALDLSAAAQAEFARRLPTTLLKTVMRAIAKETARRKADEKDEMLGWIINAANVATEQADTRGWNFLPGRIDLLKASVAPGSQTIRARFRDAAGEIVEEVALEVEIEPGRTTFVSIRSFQ